MPVRRRLQACLHPGGWEVLRDSTVGEFEPDGFEPSGFALSELLSKPNRASALKDISDPCPVSRHRCIHSQCFRGVPRGILEKVPEKNPRKQITSDLEAPKGGTHTAAISSSSLALSSATLSIDPGHPAWQVPRALAGFRPTGSGTTNHRHRVGR